MSVTRLIASMKAAGCSAEQIGAAVLSYTDGGERSAAAIRQARYRAKKKGIETIETVTPSVTVDVTRNVTVDAKRDVTGDPLACAFSMGEEVSILPPEKPTVSTPKGEKQKRSERGTRLTDDWRPNDQDRAWSVEQLGSNAAARVQLEKFRDYWRAKAGSAARKLNWDMTWRNWVRDAVDKLPRAGPPRQSAPAAMTLRNQALAKIYNEPSHDDQDEPPLEAAPADASGSRGRVILWAGGAR